MVSFIHVIQILCPRNVDPIWKQEILRFLLDWGCDVRVRNLPIAIPKAISSRNETSDLARDRRCVSYYTTNVVANRNSCFIFRCDIPAARGSSDCARNPVLVRKFAEPETGHFGVRSGEKMTSAVVTVHRKNITRLFSQFLRIPYFTSPL